MNKLIKVLQISIVTSVVTTYAFADEMNFGKAAPSDTAIIEHFKSSSKSQEAGVTPLNGDNYQDVSQSDLQDVRGLSKIKTFNEVVAHKTKHETSQSENAISMQITFDYNSAILRDQSLVQLDPLGRALSSADLSGMKFRVEGHTDAIGSDDFNIDLSRRRADAVKQFLMHKYGIAASSIQIEGKGKVDLADSSNPASEINRRVRIVSLGKN
jgi:outer membrane protein OmpA-like peptidoglycan-associated protein